VITLTSSVEEAQLLSKIVVVHVPPQGVSVDPCHPTDLRGAKLAVAYEPSQGSLAKAGEPLRFRESDPLLSYVFISQSCFLSISRYRGQLLGRSLSLQWSSREIG
jgi:hypothetical protein